jgi:hypothetical protein
MRGKDIFGTAVVENWTRQTSSKKRHAFGHVGRRIGPMYDAYDACTRDVGGGQDRSGLGLGMGDAQQLQIGR